MPSQEEIIDHLSTLSVIDLVNLTKSLEEKWGVKAAPVAVAGTGGGVTPPTPPPVEATEFTVVLKGGGASKIGVIKVVREVTGLGLKEAKDLVDGAPKDVKVGVNKADSEEIAKKLKDAGAEVEIKPVVG